MGLNRILMKANGRTIEGDGEFIMTMGNKGRNMAIHIIMLTMERLMVS